MREVVEMLESEDGVVEAPPQECQCVGESAVGKNNGDQDCISVSCSDSSALLRGYEYSTSSAM